jgi:hypothetical protein
MFPFHHACRTGKVNIVKSYLDDPNFNGLNEKDNDNNTPFFCACVMGRKEIVKMIINRKDFNSLNDKNRNGATSLFGVCLAGRGEIVKMIIEHKNFNTLNDKNDDGCLPFYCAYYQGHRYIVEELLKQPNIIVFDELPLMVRPINYLYRAELNELVLSYKKDPIGIRTKLILIKNIDTYLHIIFLSDGYYGLKQDISVNPNNLRFFKIASCLPIELQMVIIHRLSKSSKFNIPGYFIEEHLKTYIEKNFK